MYSLLDHHVGTYVAGARIALGDGLAEEAENSRTTLIDKLEEMEAHPVVQTTVSYLRDNGWDTTAAIAAFQTVYEALLPEPEVDMGDAVSSLFGNR